MRKSLAFACLALGAWASASSAATVTNLIFNDTFDLEAGQFNTDLDN